MASRILTRFAGLRTANFTATSTAARAASTQALVLEKIGELGIRDIEINEPFTSKDVRIDIKSVGICGSDVHYYQHGSIGPFVLNEPMVLGHEAAGVVTEVGADVEHLQVGDRVCMEPGIPDPHSKWSRLGKYNVDPKVRFWATPPYHPSLLEDPAWQAGHGCLRPSVVHPADFTFKIPDHISYDEAALVEPLAVGMHSCTKAQIKPGDRAVVIGAGPIGMLTALTALAAGCAKVLMVDTVQQKLDVAESLSSPGKIVGVLAGPDLAERVTELTGEGAEVIIECSGNPHACAGAAELAAPGGCIVYVGCPTPVTMDIGHMQVRELRTESVFRYAHMYPKSISLLDSGSIDVKPIITNIWEFDQSAEAFDFMCSPPDSTIKSIIRM
jgi:D-xylulose reductase